MYAGDSWTWRVLRVVTGWVIGKCAGCGFNPGAGGKEGGGREGAGTESWSQSGSC